MGVVQISLCATKAQANQNDSSMKNQQECSSVKFLADQIMKKNITCNWTLIHIGVLLL